MKIEFTDCLVSSYQTGGSDVVPLDTISLNFAKIVLEYKEQKKDGTLDETERALPCAPKVMEVISNSALRITPGHLEDLAAIVETGNVEDVRKALFDLVAQVRGEKPGAAPNLRVIAGG